MCQPHRFYSKYECFEHHQASFHHQVSAVQTMNLRGTETWFGHPWQHPQARQLIGGIL